MAKIQITEKLSYTFFTVLFLITISTLYYVFINKINFSPLHNIIFGSIIFFVLLAISIKSFLLYNQTQDKRMAVLSASFLSSSIFEIFHILHSSSLNLEFAYWYFEVFTILSGLLILIIYSHKPITDEPKKFQSNVFLNYLSYTLVALILLNISGDYIGIIALSLPLESIFSAFYILFAFILADVRLNKKLPVFSPFILGILLLVFSDMFEPTLYFVKSQYRFFLHFSDIFALLLIFTGLKDQLVKSDYFSLKEKILLYNGLFVSFLYFLVIIYSSFVIGFDFQSSFNYMFFAIFFVMIVSFYFLTKKITAPIANIIDWLINYKPGEKPEQLKVISDDEIGSLTTEFNKNAIQIYDYSVKEKESIKREQILRGIIEKIRSSLELEETLSFICEETAKLFNVQRVALAVFPNQNNLEEYIIKKEYKSSPAIKDHNQVKNFEKAAAYWGAGLLLDENGLAFDNIEDSNTPDYFKNVYRELGVKSMLGASVRKGENAWGTLVLSEYNTSRHWSKEEKNLLNTIADQVYISINQAELFEKTKQTAERERLLRIIVETLRSSLELTEVKGKVVKILGEAFNADRCYFRSYDRVNDKFAPVDVEYLSSPEVKSLLFIEPNQEGLKLFSNEAKKQKTGFTPVIVNKEVIKGTATEDYFKSSEIKADYAVPIINREEEVIWLVLHYSKEDPKLNEDDLELLETIAYQIDITFEQLKLYNAEKISAEREKISRNIVEILRSSLDKNIIKHLFVRNIGKLFDADRVIFSDYDKKNKIYLPVDRDSEYLSSPSEKSFVNFDWTNISASEFIQPLLEKREFLIESLDEYIEKSNKSQDFISLFKDANIQSSYNFPVLYQGEIMGFFCIDFSKEIHKLSTEDINRIRSMCTQAGIALYHADLLTQIQESTKEKEKFILEIASGSKAILENIVEISSQMANTEAKCEEHIKHISRINDVVKQLLELTSKFITDTPLN